MKSTLLIVLTLSVICISYASGATTAIKCYSHIETVGKGFDKNSSSVEVCSSGLCKKHGAFGTFNRGCGSEGSKVGCSGTGVGDLKIYDCYCNTELCNGANAHNVLVLTTVISVLTIFAATKALMI